MTTGNGKHNLVMGIYFHPEAFPPTLNAIGELSDCFDHITIVHRPHLKGTWQYPGNVKAVASGRYISAADQEKAPLRLKMLFFVQFIRSLLQACRKEKPAVILVYDSLSLLAYHLIRPLLNQHTIWYHNHDVTEMDLIRKYSISWFAARQEVRSFTYLDIFSLPTHERLQYFPMGTFKGKYFFIPNYPAARFYAPFYTEKHLADPIRIIFQGSIGPYHGIEEIIPLLKERIGGYGLALVLKGPCREEYRQKYTALAEQHQVSDKLTFLGVTPYAEVPVASSTCHIGLGILAKQDVMNTTLGTASNKLYEYAAVGLPVIYYNHDNFTRHLGKYAWALPCGLTCEAIREEIASLPDRYERLSASAHSDFIGGLNYEKGFAGVKSFLLHRK